MRTTNLLLDEAARRHGPGATLPNESALAKQLGVSRTAVHAALVRLVELQLVERRGRSISVLRLPRATDYYGDGETESRGALIERRFMEMALSRQLEPGVRFSESDLARRIGVSTVSVREFLISFSRYGVVAKDLHGGWRLGAFDRAFGEELAAMRRMLELDAIRQFAIIAADDPAWQQIDAFLDRHALVSGLHATEPRLFAELDREFHRFLVGRMRNRFVDSFYDIIAFVFHYHYQWDQSDEVSRNEVALREHEAVLRALADHDIATAERRLDEHLATAVRTLVAAATSPRRRYPGEPGDKPTQLELAASPLH